MSKKLKKLVTFSIIFLLVAVIIILFWSTSSSVVVYIKDYRDVSLRKLLVWDHYLGDDACMDYPRVADFDGDGSVDVLFDARIDSHSVYLELLDSSNGSVKWKTVFNETVSYSSTYPDYGNFFGDKPLEVVIGVDSNLLLFSGLNGSVLDNVSFPIGEYSASVVYSVDVDDDGLDEAVYQLGNKIYVIDFTANEVLYNVTVQASRTLLAFYDTDKDGLMEFFYVTQSGFIIGYDFDLGVILNISTGHNNTSIYKPMIFVGKNKDVLGIFIIDTYIVCVNVSNGVILWEIDASRFFKTINVLSPVVNDYDRDGVKEIFIAEHGGGNEFIVLNELGEVELTVDIIDSIVYPLHHSNIIVYDVNHDGYYDIMGLGISLLYFVDLHAKRVYTIDMPYSLNPEDRYVTFPFNGIAVIKNTERVVVTTLNHISVIDFQKANL